MTDAELLAVAVKCLDPDLIERHGGRVLYVHAPDCPSYCDYACNGAAGERLAVFVESGGA